MSAAHTPGTIEVFNGHLLRICEGETCTVIAESRDPHRRGVGIVRGYKEGMENMRRLAACWNACEGLSTERLEDLGRPLMAHLIGCDERAARMVKERETLLAAARRAVLALAFAAESSPAMLDDYKALSAAIAAAQGEAQ